MSNQDQYLKLWQQKRDELQIDIDLQADWSDMQRLLNTHMPVAKPAAGDTSLFRQLLTHLAKFKLLYVVAALLVTGAITYVALQNRAAIKNIKHKTELRKDSLAIDSLLNTFADTAINNIDGQKDTLADGTLIAPVSASEKNSAKPGSNNEGKAAVNSKYNTDLSTNKAGKSNADNTIGSNTSSKNNIAGVNNNPTNNTGNPGINITNRNSKIIKNSTGKLNNTPASNRPAGTANNRRHTRSQAVAINTKNLASGASINSDIGLLNSRRRSSLNSNGVKDGISTGRSQQTKFGTGSELQRVTTGTQTEPDLMTNGRRQGIPLLPQSFTTVFGDISILKNSAVRLLPPDNSYLPAGANKSAGQPLSYSKTKPVKPAKTKNQTASTSGLDWGILIGVNTPGSFTPKAQNKNIYGSLPVDAYTGLFTTYNFNKLAVDVQVKLLIPNNASDNYNHVYIKKNDTTGATVTQTFKITDSRKIYSAQVPVHLVYNITKNISLKAGPVINLPIKQFGATTITPATGYKDTLGYLKKLTDTASTISFEKKLSLGISGGVGFNFKRLRLEATYYRGSQPYKITSPLRSYSNNTNNVQITLGFKLNKTKP